MTVSMIISHVQNLVIFLLITQYQGEGEFGVISCMCVSSALHDHE